jgi:prevent-host-death family protein
MDGLHKAKPLPGALPRSPSNWTKRPADAYVIIMSSHSVTEAESQLSRLIDRALEGEPVVITRDGHPVVEIKPLRTTTRASREAEIARIEATRLKLPEGVDVQAILRQIRDGE